MAFWNRKSPEEREAEGDRRFHEFFGPVFADIERELATAQQVRDTRGADSTGTAPDAAWSQRAKPVVAWEYKERTVLLHITAKTASGDFGQEAAVRNAAIEAGWMANQKIMRALQEEGVAGWQAEGPTDLLGLLLAGQVRWRQSGGLLLSWKFEFELANLRLKRMRP